MERSPTAPAPADAPDPGAREDGWLVCVDCRARIAPANAKIEVAGAHHVVEE